eukprot:SAG11_NODE_23610_length_385_cov_1.496503_1_plen_70_part_01
MYLVVLNLVPESFHRKKKTWVEKKKKKISKAVCVTFQRAFRTQRPSPAVLSGAVQMQMYRVFQYDLKATV